MYGGMGGWVGVCVRACTCAAQVTVRAACSSTHQLVCVQWMQGLAKQVVSITICAVGLRSRRVQVQFYYIWDNTSFLIEFQAVSFADVCKSKYCLSVPGPRIWTAVCHILVYKNYVLSQILKFGWYSSPFQGQIWCLKKYMPTHLPDTAVSHYMTKIKV